MSSSGDFTQNPVLARMALGRVPGLGPKAREAVIEFCGGAEKVFLREVADLVQETGMDVSLAEQILCADKEGALHEWEKVQASGIQILSPEMPGYPEEFQFLSNPPSVLYVRGSLPQNERRIAVVGTRTPTVSGLRNAREFSRELAALGISIVSGLARGIDTASHEGALAGSGRTYAVMGTGFGRIYPAENIRLAGRISENGAVLTEYGFSDAGRDFYFPMRNRLISALSRGVLVVEAPLKSGALITADWALEQGKDVFAIPGPVRLSQSEGPNRLIKEGAFCVTEPHEIPAHLGWDSAAKPEPHDAAPIDQASKEILEFLSTDEPMGFEELASLSGLRAPALLAKLSELEALGRIASAGMGRYLRQGDSR